MSDTPTPAFDPAHIARLARLALPPEELTHLAHDLQRILGHVAQLQALELASVPPTSHPLDLHAPPRPDVATAPLDRDLALSGSRSHDDVAFIVPRVV